MTSTDVTQVAAADAEWSNEPVADRHKDMLIHTPKPFNAEPPNEALQEMFTKNEFHYCRQHTPVPVIDEQTYRVSIGCEGKENDTQKFSLNDLKTKFKTYTLAATLMCTGNRRSEFNNETDGETMGLKWKNGSISTAQWTGCSLAEVMKAAGVTADSEDEGYRHVTFIGVENYKVSIPLRRIFQKEGDCSLVWLMNGDPLPRDHGYPLRLIIPGYVGARSVKWIGSVMATKEEADGMHQKGIAYKMLAPNQKALASVSKQHIEDLPPIDSVPITSAITLPNPGTQVRPGQTLNFGGYAYAGAGLAVIRVDVSVDSGKTWSQAEIQRADPTQTQRSGRAWAWVQWRHTVKIPDDAPADLKVFCKAVDDQHNQQPHSPSPIWNLRGILNCSWGQVVLKVQKDGALEMSPEACSGDGTVQNVGVKTDGTFECPECRQKFGSERAKTLHWKFIHDPNRHQED